MATVVASLAGDRTGSDFLSSRLIRRAVPTDVAKSVAFVTFHFLRFLDFLGTVTCEVSTLPTVETLVTGRISGLVCQSPRCRQSS